MHRLEKTANTEEMREYGAGAGKSRRAGSRGRLRGLGWEGVNARLQSTWCASVGW